MPDYLQMELSELLDQLTIELAKHTQMLKDKRFNKDYDFCKKNIAEINKVIKLRMIESADKDQKFLTGDEGPDFISPGT